jgi:hypothetical protein
MPYFDAKYRVIIIPRIMFLFILAVGIFGLKFHIRHLILLDFFVAIVAFVLECYFRLFARCANCRQSPYGPALFPNALWVRQSQIVSDICSKCGEKL